MSLMVPASIQIENLSKRYALGEASASYKTFRETLVRAASAPIRTIWSRTGERRGASRPTIWALRDVSMSIEPGEVVGIVGCNGAGKTTLLKILSRITEPTRGRVVLRGRVGSLLEVGTGFHPELTGRENIYLNGAILGMRRVEINRRFEEIVAFSEVEQFIDTPVKRYSSGMYTRLAFSVAAHMEPEVLLVDEVLAVGDLAFQKKCIGKMDEIAEAGRTVLFVSHNMQAIRNLCPRTVVLDEGRIICDAPTSQAINRYNDVARNRRVEADTAQHDPDHRRGSGSVRFTNIVVTDRKGEPRFEFEMGETILFRMSFRVTKTIPELLVAVGLRSSLSGEFVTTVRHVVSNTPLEAGTENDVTIECPEIMIRPGQYPLYFWLGNSMTQPFDVIDDVTAPLVIISRATLGHLDFNREAPVGLVSIPSRVAEGHDDR
jgi:lipopolysaccharide transport system ATP-binding protein